MRILFVGMVDSVHTARWISQIVDEGWEIYLFPVARAGLAPNLPKIKVFSPYLSLIRPSSSQFQLLPWLSPYFWAEPKLAHFLKRPLTVLREDALARVIQMYKPDLIHSLEMQHAGYLTLAARDQMNARFPKWAVTIWGSDLYLFGRLKEHKSHIQSILAACDYFGCESERDMRLAKNSGLKGKILPILPATGGFELDHCESFKQPGLSSERRTIVLKGYQHFSGRALAGLRALARCADLLNGYRLSIYGASPDVVLAAELFSQDTKIPVDIISGNGHEASDEQILRAFGQARIAIGLGISDGLPRTFLEAIVMGAFPIQSDTACANEWIENGKSGFIVPAEDPDIIAEAIRAALLNDDLVDQASKANAHVARDKLDVFKIKPQVVKMYREMLEERRK